MRGNPRVEYLAEYLARTQGKKLGIVTNSDVFDATPASMAIHTQNRGAGTGIVDQFFDDRRLTGLTVLMGGAAASDSCPIRRVAQGPVAAPTGIAAAEEPALYLRGRYIGLHETSDWPALAVARDRVERCGGRQPEPDCRLHVPGQAWILVDAKFGSPTATNKDDVARNAWAERYSRSCPGVFRKDVILETPPRQIPAQLLRNVAVATQVRQPCEQVIVVALVRQANASCVDVLAHRCLNDGLGVKVRLSTWEQVYSALPERPSLDRLRRYLERKSFMLQLAFSIWQQNGGPHLDAPGH